MRTRRQQRKKYYAARALCSGRPISPGEKTTDGVLSVQRALQESQKEKSDLHYKIQQIEEEKLQLEGKCRQLEARNKDLEEKQQDLQNTIEKIHQEKTEQEVQMQDELKAMQNLYNDLKVRFGETKCQNEELLEEKKQQEAENLILQDFERRSLELQEFCNKENEETLKLQREKEIQLQDELKALQNLYNVVKVRFCKTKFRNRTYREEKKQQEAEKRILWDLERRSLALLDFCNNENDKTRQLQREKETVEKRCSKMKRRIDGMKRRHSVVMKEMLLESNDLKSQMIEMQAQQQQQEEIHEDLQRKNELLEEMLNKKQERNTDMCEANLMEEAAYKELTEKLGEKQAALKETEQRCQQLEQQNGETNDQLRTVILEKKELVEKYLKKKRKGLFG